MCPNKGVKAKRGFISSLFKKVVDECEKYKANMPTFSLTGAGESLLHPKIIDMLKYVKTKGFREVKFSTNASLLNEEVCDEVIKLG